MSHPFFESFVSGIGSPGTAGYTFGVDGTDNATLAIDPDSTAPVMLTRHVADNAPAIMRLQKRGTTGNVDGAVSNNDNIARFDFYAWDGTSFLPGANIQLTAAENFTPTAHGSRLTFQIVDIGSSANIEMLRLTSVGADLRNSAVLQVAGTQVVSARNTGWTTFIGTANKNAGALDTGTATTAQVAQVVKSIMDALIAHGLIGT